MKGWGQAGGGLSRAAQALGITGIQVRTGTFRYAHLAAGAAPNALLDGVADLPSWLRSLT